MLGTAPFVAKKALEQSRRLGSARIAEAINLIAAADLDVRGASGMDAEIVVEILVARLARQTRPVRSSRPRPPPTGAPAPAPARRPPPAACGRRPTAPANQPAVVLRVPDAVLAQAVGLVGRRTVDPCPGRLDAGVVRVDVGNPDGEAALRRGGMKRGAHLMLGRDLV